jgi:hypothetical protein
MVLAINDDRLWKAVQDKFSLGVNEQTALSKVLDLYIYSLSSSPDEQFRARSAILEKLKVMVDAMIQ